MVLLDAANIACKRPRSKGKPKEWHFARVERVRKRCQKKWHGAHVRAVIDAEAENRLTDRKRADNAHAEGWLDTASGDADDIVLAMAASLNALVVSKDTFKDARRSHPWLEEEGRVWSFTIPKNGRSG